VSVRKLPAVDLEGEAYFFDFRLSQLRKVGEPHKFIDLSPSESRDFLEALASLEVARRRADRILGDVEHLLRLTQIVPVESLIDRLYHSR
jgi:hypothetical protein